MAKSIWTQTEAAHGIETGQLRAVIYYSDRSWSNVTVFGPKAVVKAVSEPKPWGTPRVTHKAKSDLKAVPTGMVFVREATEFGLSSGKVLLVSGYPPEG